MDGDSWWEGHQRKIQRSASTERSVHAQQQQQQHVSYELHDEYEHERHDGPQVTREVHDEILVNENEVGEREIGSDEPEAPTDVGSFEAETPSSTSPLPRRPRTRIVNREVSSDLLAARADNDAALRRKQNAKERLDRAHQEFAEAQRVLDDAIAFDKASDELVELTSTARMEAELQEPSPWNDRFKELKKFHDEHGHCMVPQRRTDLKLNHPDVYRLGKWVSKQREAYKKPPEHAESLHRVPYRITALESLGFLWNQNTSAWEKRYHELLEFKKEHGHTHVPVSHPSNPELGRWVNQQKTLYKMSHESQERHPRRGLTKERQRLLEEAGFDFNSKHIPWDVRFKELLAFKEEFGHMNVPHAYQRNPQLASWVGRQRNQYKEFQKNKTRDKPVFCCLTEERIKTMEDAGFVWNQLKSTWMDRYREMKAYYEKHGDCLISASSNSKGLGGWVRTQRVQYRLLQETRKSQMTPERIRLLEEIGFSWRVQHPRRGRKPNVDSSIPSLNSEMNAPEKKVTSGQKQSRMPQKAKVTNKEADDEENSDSVVQEDEHGAVVKEEESETSLDSGANDSGEESEDDIVLLHE